MYEIILQSIPSVEKLGDVKEWVFYVISILVSYGIGTSVAIKYLYKKNITIYEKYNDIYPHFLDEQKNFYKLYGEVNNNLTEVIKNNSLVLQSVEMTIKNNTDKVGELAINLKEQSDKTLITLDKLTEKIIQATHVHN